MCERESMEAVLSSPAQVKALVPDFLFKRAKDIASSNKLHSVSFQGPLLHKSVATCTGSNPGDNYNVSILIDSESPSKPACQCSCPAQAKGNLCKHVIALLLLRTKELTKGAKEKSNASILSEFKQAEDLVARDREKELALSDSQATEEFVPSDDKRLADDEDTTATTAQSVLPVSKSNQKRVLPSWILEGFSAPKKETRDKKVARKTADKEDVSIEDGANTGKRVARKSACKEVVGTEGGGNSGTSRDSHRATQTRRGNGKSKAADKVETKKRPSKKRKDVDEEISDFDGEDSSGKCKQTTSSRAGRGSGQRNVDADVKRSVPKRRRARSYVESDLSEEEEPEIFDHRCSSKEDLDLTTEDLVKLANEHLETGKSNMEHGQSENAGNNQPQNASDNKPQNDTAVPKKKGSIFSVQGWNDVAAKSLDAKNGGSFSQDNSEMPVLPLTFVGELHGGNTQASAEYGANTLSNVCGGNPKDNTDSLEPAENIVDDMLGLFFGPTLNKTVSSKAESMQNLVEDGLTSGTAALPASPDILPDVVIPLCVDGAPKPKKKASLKDTVRMYLS